MDKELGKRVSNFKNYIKGIINNYSEHPACGLIHGFQKDAIQNGWGHRRKDVSKWKMEFRYIENEKGKFFIVEDFNDTGLIGKNYTNDEIEELQEKGLLGPDEKLARFSSLYNSGGNTTSAGLFGQGKVMYQAVSKEYKEYFDSYTEEEKYVANVVDGENTYVNGAYEGDAAVQYIKEQTNLDKKTVYGTRIIIVDPIDELVEALRNGELINDINETWWLIMKKYNAKIELYDGDDLLYTASIPEVYNKYYSDETHSKIWGPINVDVGYRIKKLGFIYTDEEEELQLPSADPEFVNNRLANIAYYRNDMKIGNIVEIDSLGLDPKIKNRISGFLEVDSEWEEMLKNNEGQTHYGPSNRGKKEYQKMKIALINYLNEFLELKGLKKKTKYVDPNEDLKELASDLTDFLKDCNLDLDLATSLNKGKRKPIEIKCDKMYPNEGLRTLEFGQTMKFQYKISKDVTESNFNVDTVFIDENGQEKMYSRESIVINGDEYTSDIIEVSYDDFFDENRNVVKITVSSIDNINTKASCTFPIFVGKDDTPDVEDIVFRLHNIELPNPETQRINYNEKINKIELKLINNLNKDFTAAISGFIQDVNDRNSTIDNISVNEALTVEKNSEQIITVSDVVFGEKFLNKKGPMRIKFKLSHIDGLGLRKAQELKEVFITVLYEDDLPNNTANPFDTHTDNLGDTKIKSKLVHNGDIYDLIFNIDYVMYQYVPKEKNDPFYKEYYVSEMLKTLLIMKFQNGDYSFIGCDEETIKTVTADELTAKVNSFVDSYMSQYFEMRG